MHVHSPRSLLLAAILGLAACASPGDESVDGLDESTDTEAESDAPLAQAVAGTVSYAGTGCPSSDGRSYSVTADGLTYTFRLPKLIASTSNATPKFSDCTISIKMPDARRYGVYTIKVDGGSSIPAGGTGRVHFETHVQGSGGSRTGAVDVPAPSSGKFNGNLTIAPSQILYPPGENPLITTVRLQARGTSSKPASLGDQTSKVIIRLLKK